MVRYKCKQTISRDLLHFVCFKPEQSHFPASHNLGVTLDPRGHAVQGPDVPTHTMCLATHYQHVNLFKHLAVYLVLFLFLRTLVKPVAHAEATVGPRNAAKCC